MTVAASGQDQRTRDANYQRPAPAIIDSFGRATGEDRSARFDNFFIQIQDNGGSVGYVFVYCGKLCRYGEVEAHFRGIELKTATSNISRDRLVVLHGGYRDAQEVELWLVPREAGAPIPRSTRSIRDVAFTKPTKRVLEPYDCCDDYGPYWKAFRPKPNGQKGRAP